MTTYYVGAGGNDANTGLSWAQRRLTLNGIEDKPVAAGDTVYVGPGVYREMLTCDVSGTSGNPITYIGDYTGANTDGAGGVVCITGSDNDQTATRGNCITATSKNYRTFTNFSFAMTTGGVVTLSECTDWTFNKCVWGNYPNSISALSVSGAAQARCAVRDCVIWASSGAASIQFTHTSTVNDTAHTVQNCIILGPTNGRAINAVRIGGVTVKNCLLAFGTFGASVQTALAVGQTMTVNNCILYGCQTALAATTTAEFVENYNNIFGCNAARSNVNVGANSNAYPPLFDLRWFFQLVNAAAANQVVTPFDLSSWSQLINLAGTAPTTTDMRGTSAIGGTREIGALEYDSRLKIQGGGSGGAVSISPLRSRLGG